MIEQERMQEVTEAMVQQTEAMKNATMELKQTEAMVEQTEAMKSVTMELKQTEAMVEQTEAMVEQTEAMKNARMELKQTEAMVQQTEAMKNARMELKQTEAMVEQTEVIVQQTEAIPVGDIFIHRMRGQLGQRHVVSGKNNTKMIDDTLTDALGPSTIKPFTISCVSGSITSIFRPVSASCSASMGWSPSNERRSIRRAS
ncbi:hypothetical protein JB92DRAFT_878157 [Gautieria morchelliformis]|nr:hypothetical protein JB92DRAFT_878157 [Gautieria morchelliformis]